MSTIFDPKHPDKSLPDDLDAEYSATEIICKHCKYEGDCGGRCSIYNQIEQAYQV
jgi:radical SAM protein with 4Fe4S-binding SPASM domain